MPNSYFHSEYNSSEDVYRVESKDKLGRIFICRCSKVERDRLKESFHAFEKEIQKVPSRVIEHEIMKPKKEAKRIDPVIAFYGALNSMCFFELNIFSLHLFNEKGMQIDFVNPATGELVNELIIGRFYLVKNEYTGTRIDCKHIYVEINNEYSLLVVYPELKFHDRRFGLQNVRGNGKEISYSDVKHLIKNVDDYGYPKEINFISESREVNISLQHEMIKETVRVKKFSERVIKKVMKEKPLKEEYIIKVKGSSNKRLWNKNEMEQNKIAGKIDAQMRKKRAEKYQTLSEALYKF